MPSRVLLGMAAIISILARPASVEAQPTRALSLDVHVGVESVRASGEYRNPKRGAAVDAMLALRLRGSGRGAVLAGVSAGSPWAWPSSDICLPASTGGCIPTHPPFVKIGALVGWENPSTTLRVMGGPAYVRADGASAIGVQARVDGAVPIAHRLALVASVRATMVPNYRGDAFQVYAIGLGVRVR